MQNFDLSAKATIKGDSSSRTRSNVKLAPLENSSRKSYGMKIRANDSLDTINKHQKVLDLGEIGISKSNINDKRQSKFRPSIQSPYDINFDSS